MEEPSPHSSRIALAAGIAAALLVGGAGFLLGRGTSEREPVVAPPAPITAPSPRPTPTPDRALGPIGRAELIALAATAADAAAAGRAPGEAIAEAAGRRFELRLPFGCAGPASESSNAAMRWRYDAGEEALRLHVAPVTWSARDWWGEAAPETIESIEGFWIMRPWTTDEGCPAGGEQAAATGAEPVTLPGQTLAIGQIFTSDGARGGRRDGSPYQSVVRIAEDALDSSQGFRLRLTGRIARIRGAPPVQCRQPASPEQRPLCLIQADFDEVAIENPATGETLATWSVDAADAPAG